ERVDRQGLRGAGRRDLRAGRVARRVDDRIRGAVVAGRPGREAGVRTMAATTTSTTARNPRRAYEVGLGLTEEHGALADAVRGFAESALTTGTVRAALADLEADPAAEPRTPGFWPALVRQDLPGLHVPERLGGSEGGLLTLAVALEAMARSVSPGPFVPTALAAAVLTAADAKATADLVPGLADGTLT